MRNLGIIITVGSILVITLILVIAESYGPKAGWMLAIGLATIFVFVPYVWWKSQQPLKEDARVSCDRSWNLRRQ